MEKFKKTGLFDGSGSEGEEFKYDPEAVSNGNKYRLPFALCKERGIEIQDWWTPRNAWDALERGGHVADVSEEYKEYFRNLKKESNKKYRERAKRKQAQLKDSKHNSTKGYVHQDGAIDGAVKGAPMSFEQADKGNVNPYFRNGIGYGHNCQTCVAVYYARRMGYDVSALPNLNNRNIMQLSHDTNLAYRDASGQHPKSQIIPKGARVDVYLDSTIKSGEIYSFSYRVRGRRSGHIIIAERDKDGSVMLYDPQVNSTAKGKEITSYVRRSRAYEIELTKLTGCVLDEKFCNSIMKNKSRSK